MRENCTYGSVRGSRQAFHANTTLKGVSRLSTRLEKRVLNIQGQQVLLDRDVAELYAVETKDVNRAVKNNLNKFPEGYIISLDTEEWNSLRLKYFTLKNQGRGGTYKI